ncbi:ribonuclease Z [Clostridium sp. CTA-19]
MINVTLLGCGGGMPMPFRNLASLLINYKGRKILIDCGEGTQVSMRLAKSGFKSIDIICITHIHGDHIVGLPGLLSTIGNSGREEELIIIGPEGIKDTIEGLSVICPYLPYEIKVIEAPKKNLKFELKDKFELTNDYSDIEISMIDLEHSSPCLGYGFYINRKRKFDVDKAINNNVPKILWSKLQKYNSYEFEGKLYFSDMVLGDERKGLKLSYITDSRPISSIKEFIKGSDLFICEGTYGSDDDIEKAIKNKHMIFREAASLAKEGKVKKLILTHFSPSLIEPDEYIENGKEVFKNTILGSDRMEENLTFK